MHSEAQHPRSKHRTFKQTGTTTIFSFRNTLVHLLEKPPVLVVTVELIWLLFLNILSFNFIQMPNQSLAIYTGLLSFTPTTAKVTLLLFLDVGCPKCPHSSFCSFLSPTLLYWSVALNQILLLQKYPGTSPNIFYRQEAYSSY